MSIAFNGIIAFLFRGVNLAVAVGILLFCTNQMEAPDYGALVLGLTVVGLVNSATGGLTAATAYQIANQRRDVGVAFTNSGFIGGWLGILAVAAGALAGQAAAGDAGSEAPAIGAACAAVILNGVLAGAFLGRESLVRYNLALVCPPLFALAAIVAAFLSGSPKTPEVALTMYAVGQWGALALLGATGNVLPHGRVSIERPLVRDIARFAAVAGVASGISYLNYRADLFLVRHFEGKEGVAVYSIAVNIAESVWQVSGSLALAVYARVGSLERAEAAALTARVMRHTVVLLAVVCSGLFVFAGVIENVFPADYAGMAAALRFILPGVLLYGLAQSFAGFYTYQRGMPWVSSVVAGSGLVIDLALAAFLIPAMGVNGAALASAIAYSLAILGGLAAFARSEGLGPRDIFKFGKAEVEDYRTLLTRIRGLAART